jgi:tripartite-type tricarboxylate transporter receptor subunit TctC
MSTFGFFAPASMPRSAQQRIHEEINRLLAQPDLRQKLIDFDNLPAPLSQPDFGALVKREFDANARIVKSANIRAD